MKFTLRDMFWLTLVLAMGLGWWISQPPPRGYSQGRIVCGGKPLAVGWIFFRSENGQMFVAQVLNGEYEIWLDSGGEFQVSIEGEGVPHQYRRSREGRTTINVSKFALNNMQLEISGDQPGPTN